MLNFYPRGNYCLFSLANYTFHLFRFLWNIKYYQVASIATNVTKDINFFQILVVMLMVIKCIKKSKVLKYFMPRQRYSKQTKFKKWFTLLFTFGADIILTVTVINFIIYLTGEGWLFTYYLSFLLLYTSTW